MDDLSDQFQEEEDEDWTDTRWADGDKEIDKTDKAPLRKQDDKITHTKLALPFESKTSVTMPSGLKKQMEEGKKPDVVSRMALNDNKAGMAGLDREKINKIIMEASTGSKFYENERKKEEQVNKRIDEQKKKLDKISQKEIFEAEIEADELLLELDSTRDLSRLIVHVDMDAFYAAAEMRDNPSLKDKPMAVGGNSMLSTSNYAARRFGVRAAMPGFIGKKLCPDLVIVPLNFEKYTTISKQVRAVMAEYDPNYCPMSLDEAYLDLTEHLKKRQSFNEAQRTYKKSDWKNFKKDFDSETNLGYDGAKEDRDTKRSEKPSAGVCKKVEQGSGDKNSGLHGKSSREKETQCDKFGDISFDDELDSLMRDIPNDIGEEDNDKVKRMQKSAEETVCEEIDTVVFGLSADEAVREMRYRIEQVTGLTASAGIAPNMMLAKVCSDKNKPNGQYRIPSTREAVLEFIKDLPIRKICGIGKVSESMLKALDVTMCEHLYEKRAILSHLYSAISFNYFMRICIAIGSTRVESDGERKSMSVERTFNEINKPAELYKKCLELSEALAEDLQEENLKGRTVTIKLKTVAFEVKTRAQSLTEHTSDLEIIYSTARELLRLEIQACHPNPLRLRLLGVRSSNFQDTETGKKKQCTIKDMFQRVHKEKPMKKDLETICEQESVLEKADENGNNVKMKSKNELSGPPVKSVEKDMTNVVKYSKSGQINLVDNLEISARVNDSVDEAGVICVEDNQLSDLGNFGKNVAEDEMDPVYLQDTDVDSDTEASITSKRVHLKDMEIVSVASFDACDEVCKDSVQSLGQSGAKFQKKEEPKMSSLMETELKDDKTDNARASLNQRENCKFDSDIGLKSGILGHISNSRENRLALVDHSENLVPGAVHIVTANDAEIKGDHSSCNKIVMPPGVNAKNIRKQRDKDTLNSIFGDEPSDESENGAKDGHGSNKEVGNDGSRSGQLQEIPCPVCNETIFCKDMIEFNVHLDNCLCGNSQIVSQNLRSQTIGNSKVKTSKQQKVKRVSTAKRRSPNLNETLDKFMFKQEKPYSLPRFNEEENRDCCDFLSYEESFAEDSVDFDDINSEDVQIVAENDNFGNANIDSTIMITDNVGALPNTKSSDISKTEIENIPCGPEICDSLNECVKGASKSPDRCGFSNSSSSEKKQDRAYTVDKLVQETSNPKSSSRSKSKHNNKAESAKVLQDLTLPHSESVTLLSSGLISHSSQSVVPVDSFEQHMCSVVLIKENNSPPSQPDSQSGTKFVEPLHELTKEFSTHRLHQVNKPTHPEQLNLQDPILEQVHPLSESVKSNISSPIVSPVEEQHQAKAEDLRVAKNSSCTGQEAIVENKNDTPLPSMTVKTAQAESRCRTKKSTRGNGKGSRGQPSVSKKPRQRSSPSAKSSATKSKLELSIQDLQPTETISAYLSSDNPLRSVGKPLSMSKASVDKPLSMSKASLDKPLSMSKDSVDKPLSMSKDSVDKPPSMSKASVDKPLSMSKASVDKPLSMSKASVDKPVSMSKALVDKPLSMSKASVDKPLSMSNTSVDKPFSMSKASVDKRLSMSNTSVDKPLSTSKALVDKPLSMSKASVDKPLSTSKASADKPLSMSIASVDKTLLMSKASVDKRLSMSNTSVDKPLSTSKALVDKPLSMSKGSVDKTLSMSKGSASETSNQVGHDSQIADKPTGPPCISETTEMSQNKPLSSENVRPAAYETTSNADHTEKQASQTKLQMARGAKQSKSRSQPSGLLCPICNKMLRTKNLENFNRHIDTCLSGQSKREQKLPKRKASLSGGASKRYKVDCESDEDMLE